LGPALAGSKCRQGDELPRNGSSSASLPSAYAKSSSLSNITPLWCEICDEFCWCLTCLTDIFLYYQTVIWKQIFVLYFYLISKSYTQYVCSILLMFFIWFDLCQYWVVKVYWRGTKIIRCFVWPEETLEYITQKKQIRLTALR